MLFIQKLEQYIPEDSKVWGSMTFWLGLYKHPYRTQYTYGRDLDTFQPNYVILYDSDTWGEKTAIIGRKRDNSAWRSVQLKFEKLAQTRGTFISRIEDKFFGNVEIYKIDWSNQWSKAE